MSDKDVFAALEKAVLPLLSVFLLSVAPPCAVSASEPAAGDGWKYGVADYLWGAGTGGRTTTGSDIDVSFGPSWESGSYFEIRTPTLLTRARPPSDTRRRH